MFLAFESFLFFWIFEIHGTLNKRALQTMIDPNLFQSSGRCLNRRFFFKPEPSDGSLADSRVRGMDDHSGPHTFSPEEVGVDDLGEESRSGPMTMTSCWSGSRSESYSVPPGSLTSHCSSSGSTVRHMFGIWTSDQSRAGHFPFLVQWMGCFCPWLMIDDVDFAEMGKSCPLLIDAEMGKLCP